MRSGWSHVVVREFRQHEGVDYGDIFSPVARHGSARLLLAIAAVKNFQLRQFDVSIAFPSDDIDETIYMEQPEDYVDREHPEYVCQLQRIYGLKQRPIQFNNKIRTLEDIDLKPTHSDRCVFSGRMGGDIVYMALYVDDAILTSPSKRAIAALSRTFELKLGNHLWASKLIAIKGRAQSDCHRLITFASFSRRPIC